MGFFTLFSSIASFWESGVDSATRVHISSPEPTDDFEYFGAYRYVPVDSPYRPYTTDGSGVDYSDINFASIGNSAARRMQESNNLRLDWSLVTICVSILFCFVLPPIFRAFAAAPSWASSFTSPQNLPWGAAERTNAPGGLSRGLSSGRVIDVKPGELRGAAVGGAGTGGNFGTVGGGSWQSPVPSPWGTSSSNVLRSGVAATTSGPMAMGSSALGSIGNSIGSWLGLGSNGHGHHHGVLPSEAEVTETYAHFGVELQAWVPALAAVLDREVIEPMIRELDASDQMWQQALQPRGWRLTSEAPRLACQGIGPAQELNVYDRHLPRPWSDDIRAVEMWNHRQKLESYLVHPSFEPSQRQYVLERLREWRHRGIMSSAIRYEGRRSNDFMPSDGHILENMAIKCLNFYIEFASCFMSAGQAPPISKHLGQPVPAYLRQVTDQTIHPRPAPHYEVVAMQKVWKLRPGNSNFLEALALLLHLLRRHSRSYQSFPPAFRTAVEQITGDVHAGPSRGFQVF